MERGWDGVRSILAVRLAACHADGTPREALECFFTSPLGVLAIGPYVVDKAAT